MTHFDIFVSYAGNDRAQAQRVAAALQDQGWTVWWDRIIPTGRTFHEVIEEAIETARSVVVLWSQHSVQSKWVKKEAAEGEDRDILVPVLIERPSEWKIPWAFRSIQAADLTEWDGTPDGTAFQRLVDDLTAVLGPPPKPDPAPVRRQSRKLPPRRQLIAKPGRRRRVNESLYAGVAREHTLDGLQYVWIPPGQFQMGAVPEDSEAGTDEEPRHSVEITKGFWMAQSPVTVEAYKRFARATGQGMPPSPYFNERWEKEDHPIVRVTWEEAKAYCEWAAGRLPTEAEWEYASRGGHKEWKYPNGNEITKTEARFNASSTCAVGRYRANGYGLLDVAGNVWEWCADWLDEKYYARSPKRDPLGPPDGKHGVARGGSWNNKNPKHLRVSNRYGGGPDSRYVNVGFRCVLDRLP